MIRLTLYDYAKKLYNKPFKKLAPLPPEKKAKNQIAYVLPFI